MTDWPNCRCGHIAQDHNRDYGYTPLNYGCDHGGCGCTAYRFPAGTPTAVEDELNARRYRHMSELDKGG